MSDTPKSDAALAAMIQNHSWLPHYDLVPTRRAHALRLGAVEKSLMEYRKEVLAKATQPAC